MSETISRRRFLGLVPGAWIALAAASPGRAAIDRTVPTTGHPEPRPGIDASGVLGPEELHHSPDAVMINDAVREMPQIADGIHCYCGCADLPGYRSLLTCYEEGGMAMHCAICQGEARLAHGRWKGGQTLEQIRRAIDARYGRAGGDLDMASETRSGR